MTSEAIELAFRLLVIRAIPCCKGEECEEIFYSGDVVRRIEALIEEATQRMQETRVIYCGDAA